MHSTEIKGKRSFKNSKNHRYRRRKRKNWQGIVETKSNRYLKSAEIN